MKGLIILLIYGAIMLVTTLLFTKKEKTAEGFLAGGHNVGLGISALSIATTWIWAPALFSSAENAYTKGVPGLFWFLVPNVLCLFLFIPFAKKIRRSMPYGITLSGYMHDKYESNKVKNVYRFELGTLSVLSTAVQLLAGGKMLSLMTGLPLIATTLILSVIAFSYSQFSGIKGSIVTDAVQMIFLLVASVGISIFAFSKTGGISTLIDGLGGASGDKTSLFSDSGIEIFLGFGLPTAIGLLSGPFGDQSFWQRAFAVKKDKIGKAFGIGAVLFGIVPLAMGLLGYMGAGTGMNISDTGMVNLEVIKSFLPEWVLIPFLFMIISGLLSTVDSNLCSFASLVHNEEKEFSLTKSKLSMVVLLALAILIANIPGLTVTHLFLMYGTFRASTMLTTVMTLKGIKLSANGVTYGIIVALVLGMPIFAYGNIAGVTLAKTIGSLVTLLTSGVAAFIITKVERKVKCRTTK